MVFIENPLISVIVPVYKVEEYLHQCVESILNQTYPYLEVILVDDGSPDQCPKMCDEFTLHDSRVRVVHKENGGTAAARNTGLEKAKGDYISFVDSDDWIAPDMFEKLLNSILKHNSDMSVCAIQRYYSEIKQETLFVNNDTEEIGGEDLLKSFLFDRMGITKGDVAVAVWNKLYKKSLWDGLWFNESLKYGEDFLCLVELALHGIKASIVDEPLYFYRNRESSAMTSSNYVVQSKLAYEAAERLIKRFEEFPHYYRLGMENLVVRLFIYINYLAKASRKQDYKALRRSFIHNYWNIERQYNHEYMMKYRVGLNLLKHCPNAFWTVSRVRMSRVHLIE